MIIFPKGTQVVRKATNTTLTVREDIFEPGALFGMIVRITGAGKDSSGAAVGQRRSIISNTANTLTIDSSNMWDHNPEKGDKFQVVRDLDSLVGELQDSPTNYTVLDRLKAIHSALVHFSEASVDTGTATGGSSTTIVDTDKNWETDIWRNALAEVIVDDVHYLRFCTANTEDTVTIASLPGGVEVKEGDNYQLKIPVHVQDIERWGGAAVTGRDISADLQALTDDAITGVLKSIGDADTDENLLERIGQTDDAVAGADAAGSLAAKLRRLTADLNDLLSRTGRADESPDANTVLDRLKTIKTELDTLQTQVGEVEESPAVNTILGRLKAAADTLAGLQSADETIQDIINSTDSVGAALGETDDAAADAGASGTVSAKLRRLTADLDAAVTAISDLQTGSETLQDVIDAVQALQAASETLQDVIDSIDSVDTTIGATDDALVAAGAVGSLSAKMRRLTIDLDAAVTAIGGLQTGMETLQDIIDAVEALQTASETIQDVIDSVQDSQITDPENGGTATKIVDIAPWDRERLKDRATGAAALAHTLAPGVAWRLHEIRLHLDSAGAAENFTATLDSVAGTAYDVELVSESTDGITDIVWQSDEPMHFDEDDSVDFAFANSNTVTYGLEIVYSEV